MSLRSRSKDVALVVGSTYGDRPTLLVALGDDVKLNAGEIVKEAGKLIGGSGGGQPTLATAGGKDINGLQAAMDKAVEMIREQMQ